MVDYTRDSWFTELRSFGYTGALEDMMFSNFQTLGTGNSLLDLLFSIDPEASSLEEYMRINEPTLIPLTGLLAINIVSSGEVTDIIGTSDRDNQLRQYGTFLNGETLTSASIVGTETVISSEGTCTPVISAGTITFDAGTCWNIVLSNGSTYSHPTKTGAAVGIWFDRSGNGNHLTINVADIDAHVTEAIDQGSNTLELEGWTEDESAGVELITNGDFDTDTDWAKGSANVTISAGAAHFTNITSSSDSIYQSCTEVGKRYLVTYTIRNWSGSGVAKVRYPDYGQNISGNGTYSDILTSTFPRFQFQWSPGTISFDLDSISVQELPQGKIPLLSDLSASCLNQTPTYTGRAKYSLTPKNAPCATFDGTAGDYISIAGLTGSETVISSGGTSTPSISAGKIDFTAGTCWNLQLSNGMVFPLSESAGTTVYGYDSEDNTYTGTITASDIGAFWGSTQDSFFHDWEYGWELSGSVRIPANPYTGLSCAGNSLTTQPYQLTANDWSLPATGELRDADDIILADTASRFIYDTDGATPLDWGVDDITGGFINDQLFYGNNKISLYDDAQIDPALTKIKKYHGIS